MLLSNCCICNNWDRKRFVRWIRGTNFFHPLWSFLGTFYSYRIRRAANRSHWYGFLKILMGYIYPTVITLLLSVQAIVTAVDFVQTWDRTLVPLFFFSLVVPVQYLLACRYVRTDHFDNCITDIRHSNRSRKSLELPSLYPHLPNSLASVGIILLLTTVCTLVNALLFGYGFPAHGFDMLFERYGAHWFLYLSLILHWAYTWGALCTNLYMFMYVFSKHLTDFRDLHMRVQEKITSKFDQSMITALAREIVGLRFSLNQSVDALQGFYTSLTLLGALGIGAVIEYRVLEIYTIFYIVLYALLQLVFLTFIYNISERRTDIHKILKSPQLLFKYLTNVQSMKNVEALRSADVPLEDLEGLRISAYCPKTYADILSPRGKSQRQQMQQMQQQKQPKQQQKQPTQQQKQPKQPEPPELQDPKQPRPEPAIGVPDGMEMKILSGSIIDHDYSVQSALSTGQTTPTDPMGANDPALEAMEQGLGPMIPHLNFDLLRQAHQQSALQTAPPQSSGTEPETRPTQVTGGGQATRGGEATCGRQATWGGEATAADIESLALLYKNTAAMDWIILNSLLSEQWAEFSLLGVSFSDTEVIKKSTGLISLMILGSTFLNSLTVA